jgi:DHA1 family multidrug resistance protein-like MFS transporter
LNKSFTLITLYIIAFTGFTSISWLFPVIPYYAGNLGLNIYDTGLIVSIYSYVNAICIIPAGIISDRWGRRTFMITGLVISTIAPFLYPLAQDAAALYVIRILHGLGSALFMPTALALVTDITGEGEHGKAMGWYTASSQLGLMAGPIAGGFTLEHFGFEAAFYTCSLMPLLALIFISTRMHALPHLPLHRESPGTHPWIWLSGRGAIISLIALIMIAVGSSSVSTFIPLYVKQFGISESGAGLIITSCYISSAALRIPSGAMSDKFGNAPMVLTGMVLCAVGIALIPEFHGLLELSLVVLVFGLGMGFAMPAALSWLAQISPPHKRGFAMGLGSAAFQVGLALGSTILGMITHNNGFTFMYLSAGVAIGTAALAILLVNKYGNRPAA